MTSETRKPNGWRVWAIKMAVLFLVWAILTVVFAAQLYWVGKEWPLRISPKRALVHAFPEGCPWLILSPLVVWLAERFRFDRTRRLFGVLPHILASVSTAFAYHGIILL